MKVEIIDSKDSKRMTSEELAKRKWIGRVDPQGRKGFLSQVDGGDWSYVYANLQTGYNYSSKAIAIREVECHDSEHHVFDTAKELFAWMAE